jgi:glycerol kinase
MYIASIDQGTTSTRCMIFDHSGNVISKDQKEHTQIYPQPGWVEHDAQEIWANTQAVIAGALTRANLGKGDLAAVGITNQRETALVWEKATGKPVHNAIVWQDTRTDAIINKLGKDGGQNRFRRKVGLPLATYFSGPKIKWLLDEVPGLKRRATKGELLFGNMDTWLIWNLTGKHVTDVTNASRTLLMNLKTLDWDDDCLQAMGVPRAMLPEIKSSSEIYGFATGSLDGVPVSGILGDQQAALFGQTCYGAGEAKNTYGTGCFMLLNTGSELVQSKNGLLTTLGYKLGNQPAVYALEGSIAIAGALVQWLRDNLSLIEKSQDIEALAETVTDNGGIYFVPAFSGLYAPYWKDNARGVIAGLTRYVNKGHIARATLEATAYQTREVLDAMNKDSGVKLKALKVDGGMTHNQMLMQFQSDLLGVPVVRPTVSETTALGAAYAAGLAIGYWQDTSELRKNWGKAAEWKPKMKPAQREKLYAQWKKAVTRTFDWV